MTDYLFTDTIQVPFKGTDIHVKAHIAGFPISEQERAHREGGVCRMVVKYTCEEFPEKTLKHSQNVYHDLSVDKFWLRFLEDRIIVDKNLIPEEFIK